jgi:hypothetical protein
MPLSYNDKAHFSRHKEGLVREIEENEVVTKYFV